MLLSMPSIRKEILVGLRRVGQGWPVKMTYPPDMSGKDAWANLETLCLLA